MTEMDNTYEPCENLWGSIQLINWLQTPHIKDKLATNQDVLDGRAVFYIDGETEIHQMLNIPIPSLAYYTDNETHEKNLVIIIQGEKADDKELVGIRFSNGGNGVCLLWELDFSYEISAE